MLGFLQSLPFILHVQHISQKVVSVTFPYILVSFGFLPATNFDTDSRLVPIFKELVVQLGESHSLSVAEGLKFQSNARSIPLVLWTTSYDTYGILELDTIQWQLQIDLLLFFGLGLLQILSWTPDITTEKDPTDYLFTTPSCFIEGITEDQKNEVTCRKSQW